MRHRDLEPGQTYLSFHCRCGARLAGVVATEAAGELVEVIKAAHEDHVYELDREDAEEEERKAA